MSGAQLVKQEIAKYGRTGQEALVREAFMQFQLAFMKDGCLRAMKGAPLSTYVAVGLHEVEIFLGNAEPFTLTDIMAETGYSKPITVAALDYLVDARYIEELPERGQNREKQYRIAAYMWFGSDKSKAHKYRAHSPRAKSKETELLERDDKTFNSRPSAAAAFEEGFDSELNLHSEEHPKKQQQQFLPEVRSILVSHHVGEPLLSKACRGVSIDRARLWFEEWLPNAPKRFKRPAIFAASQLALDPEAEPPDAESEPQQGTWYAGFDEFVNR